MYCFFTTTTTTTTGGGGGGGSEHVGSSGDISEMYSIGVQIKIPAGTPAALCRVLHAILSYSRMHWYSALQATATSLHIISG